MALASGKYLTKVEKDVVVWPKADAQGDGEEVWVTEVDYLGQTIGRVRDKDKHGNEIFAYLPPAGFANRPGYDNTDNYVKVSDRGQIVRQPNGEAIGIKPGQALVFHADGSVEVLNDEYAQYVFGNAHDDVSDANPATVQE